MKLNLKDKNIVVRGEGGWNGSYSNHAVVFINGQYYRISTDTLGEILKEHTFKVQAPKGNYKYNYLTL